MNELPLSDDLKRNGLLLLFLVLIIFSNTVDAQVKIGSNPTQIVSGALLQVDGNATTTTPAKLIVTGTGNVGIATAAPNSTLHVDGSLALAVRTITIPGGGGSTTLTNADYRVLVVSLPDLSSPVTWSVTLPDPVACKGRVFKLSVATAMNPIGNYLNLYFIFNYPVQFFQSVYASGSNISLSSLLARNMELISDGTSWYANSY